MQNKSLIYWVFQNIGQFLCPKKPFSLIFIGIKVGVYKENVMPDKMLKFVNVGMQMPTKRTSGARTKDFKEIYDAFIHEKAKEQSSRC